MQTTRLALIYDILTSTKTLASFSVSLLSLRCPSLLLLTIIALQCQCLQKLSFLSLIYFLVYDLSQFSLAFHILSNFTMDMPSNHSHMNTHSNTWVKCVIIWILNHLTKLSTSVYLVLSKDMLMGISLGW